MRLSQIVWQLAIREKPAGSILVDKKAPFKAVPNPIGMWAADPFIIERDGKVYIFAELFSLFKWRGEIGYCIYENGKFSKWHIIFKDEHHYSYPYIFAKDNDIYMMPETGSRREIALYKAVAFPEKWEKTEILFSGEKLVDTVFLSDDTLLSYKMVGLYKNHLVLLKKGSEGWSLHKSVIDSDETKRPGGKAFLYNGDLIRPAQVGGELYGGALQFFKINVKEQLAEEYIDRLEAKEIAVNGLNKALIGTHTYNSTDNYEIIDVQYYKFSFVGLISRFFIKILKRRR